MNPVDFNRISTTYADITSGLAWSWACRHFERAERILYIGHGGNLAIADHAAVDCTRITKGRKIGIAPGSAVVATSFINDFGWAEWLSTWVKFQAMLPGPMCAVVLTTSGRADDIISAIKTLNVCGIPVVCITARTLAVEGQPLDQYVELLLDVDTYHDAEIASLGISYDLLTATGFECPRIK